MPSRSYSDMDDHAADPLVSQQVDHYVWTMYRDLLDQPVPNRIIDVIYRHAGSDLESVPLDNVGEFESG